jgi:hypothetical protein
MEPTREQLKEIRDAQAAAQAASDADDEAEAERLHAAAEALMRKYGAAEEPSPDLLDDDEPAEPLDPAALALAIVQARAEGDEATAKKLEAMLPPAAE